MYSHLYITSWYRFNLYSPDFNFYSISILKVATFADLYFHIYDLIILFELHYSCQ